MPTPTYSLTLKGATDSNIPTANEGDSAEFILTTTNVAAGTSLAYSLSGLSSADLTGGALSGTISVASGGITDIAIPLANEVDPEKGAIQSDVS